MKIINNPKEQDWSKILKRPSQSVEDIEDTVLDIFKDVKRQGDKAVLKYTELFDGLKLSNYIVSKSEINNAINSIPSDLMEAIKKAKSNIEKFHLAQKIESNKIETSTGVLCWQEVRAIESVGLYIPGGTAPLFSSVLMLAIPAVLAGCKEIILCSPPQKDGKIAKEVLYTANLCGVSKIYKVGGIQAIAAMTFGTESISKTHKIFGPGNQFVTVAKQLATKYGVAIDMPAGPSELLVYADDYANADYVASDLLSQAEHGVDSQVILVTTSQKLIENVVMQLKIQVELIDRKAIAKKALENSRFIYLDSKEKALDLINMYGPEHLIICSSEEEYFATGIINAGSVFLGKYTPESAGDYASGTNHTLPTNGFSKAYSGVDLSSFNKTISFQKISKNGLKNLGSTIELMAEAEGLQAHKNAVSIRLKDLGN